MTKEDEVSYFLRDWYGACESVHVHSWHPPSGKTYEGALIRIPKLDNGRRTRKRHHLDFIFQVGPFLILQELKGHDDELSQDIAKLHEILGSYSVDEFVLFLSKRVHQPQLLEKVTHLIPSVGHALPIKNETPANFIRVAVGGNELLLTFGAHFDTEVRASIERMLKRG